MSAPALVNAWYTRGEIPYPDVSTAALINKSAFWILVETLLGNVTTGTVGPEGARPSGSYWTCEGSGNGTTGAMDAVDRWWNGGTFSGALLVQAANGSAHSWMVLKSPVAMGPVYFCLDLNSATTTTAGFIFSRSAFTGGSNTTRPTASNEWAMGINTAPTSTTSIIFQADNTLASTFKAHFSCMSTGEFHFALARTTTGIFHTYMFALNAVDLKSGDIHPTWVGFNQGVTGRGAGTYVGGLTIATGIVSRNWNNTGFSTLGGASTWVFGVTALAGLMLADANDSKFIDMPIYLCHMTSTNGSQSWRGRLPDLWVQGAAVVGSSYPSTGSPTQHIIGDMVVPLSVVPTL